VYLISSLWEARQRVVAIDKAKQKREYRAIAGVKVALRNDVAPIKSGLAIP
jgi:hypothetical protein